MNQYKISFCTVSMNRLHHLQKTLPANIIDNEDYPNCEFVVLDYNSTDGMEAYVREQLGSYVDSGKLIYYKTSDPAFFHRSHSRNVALKLATGDLVCNIDADNFTGKGFASYVNDVFQKEGQICLNALDAVGRHKDFLGKICVAKDHFTNIKGFDENMSCYGFEDFDFVTRLIMSGVKSVLMDVDRFSAFLAHGNKDRLKEEYAARNLSVYLLRHIHPGSSEALFLFKDGRFTRGIIIDNFLPAALPEDIFATGTQGYQYSLEAGDWINGEWLQEGNKIVLKAENAAEVLVTTQDSHWTNNDKGHIFSHIKQEAAIMDATFLLGQISNRIQWEKNTLNEQVVANTGTFGAATVYRNFNYNTPIYI